MLRKERRLADWMESQEGYDKRSEKTRLNGERNEAGVCGFIWNDPCLRTGGLQRGDAECRPRSGLDGKAALFRSWGSQPDTGDGRARIWSHHERGHRR